MMKENSIMMTERVARQTCDMLKNSPLAFSRLALGQQLWSRQRRVLRALQEHERVAVKSCHGTGKSYVASIAVVWFLVTRRPSIVFTTGPTTAQIEKILWKEIGLRWQQLPPFLRQNGRCLTRELKIDRDHYAFGRSTDRPDRLQGIHSPHLMVVCDEASGVTDEMYEAIDTLSAGGEYRELLIGNPLSTQGKFYRAFKNEDLNYKRISIAAESTPNFSGEDVPQAIARQLINPERVRQWKKDWGEESAAYIARVKAQFPSGDAEGVLIPLLWAQKVTQRGDTANDKGNHERARKEAEKGKGKRQRQRQEKDGTAEGDGERLAGDEPPPYREGDGERRTETVGAVSSPVPELQIGVDVARFGSDRTVVAGRCGNEIDMLRSLEGRADTQRNIAFIERCVSEYLQRHGFAGAGGAAGSEGVGRAAASGRPLTVLIDETGAGAGVADGLIGRGGDCVRYQGVNFGASPTDSDRFVCKRDEMHWDVRRLCEPDGTDGKLAIMAGGPEVVRWKSQVSSIQYEYTSRGKIKLESKSDMRSRGLPGCDEADAVALAFTRSNRGEAFFGVLG